jgi:hypothetical protein
MMRVLMSRRLVSVPVAALALLAAGCGGGAATSEDTGASTAAGACSEDAILAAVKDGASDPVQGLSQFGCAGDWAYAGVITAGPDGIEYTAVLQREGEGWKTVDRAGPCKDHDVPSQIYKDACETN